MVSLVNISHSLFLIVTIFVILVIAFGIIALIVGIYFVDQARKEESDVRKIRKQIN